MTERKWQKKTLREEPDFQKNPKDAERLKKHEKNSQIQVSQRNHQSHLPSRRGEERRERGRFDNKDNILGNLQLNYRSWFRKILFPTSQLCSQRFCLTELSSDIRLFKFTILAKKNPSVDSTYAGRSVGKCSTQPNLKTQATWPLPIMPRFM